MWVFGNEHPLIYTRITGIARIKSVLIHVIRACLFYPLNFFNSVLLCCITNYS